MLRTGIVGLPNVGKSTLFNALTSAKNAQSANYPFCTIEPNVGVVNVPDERLPILAKLCKTDQIIPTAIEFVDIAGLVKGASKGEGLGNQFLHNIREVDAIIHVVRCFDDPNTIHVAGRVNPLDDITTINTELALADLASVEKREARIAKQVKSGDKEAKIEYGVLQTLKDLLDKVIRLYSNIMNRNGIEVKVDIIGSPLVAVCTDADLLQLLINLFDNSVYWLSVTGKPEKKILVTLDGNAQQMLFSDDGCGITEDDAPYIFDAFYSGKGEEGKGLGLYISRKAMERNDYTIRLAEFSDEKKLSGANFVVPFVKQPQDEY